jgi:hypothetical protein
MIDKKQTNKTYSIIRIQTDLVPKNVYIDADLILQEDGFDIKAVKVREPSSDIMSELFPNTTLINIFNLFESPNKKAAEKDRSYLNKLLGKLFYNG